MNCSGDNSEPKLESRQKLEPKAIGGPLFRETVKMEGTEEVVQMKENLMCQWNDPVENERDEGTLDVR